MRAGRAKLLGMVVKHMLKQLRLLEQKHLLLVLGQEKDAGYYTYFVVKQDSELKKFTDVKGKILSLNTIGSKW